MNKLIVANWKMNPSSPKEALMLAKASDKSGVVIVPPFVFLESVGKELKKASLGAQDIFWENAGPYTGEISWSQLKRLRTKYIIIGHSERRALGETDLIVNKKLKAALAHGFKAILCVGEPWLIRRKGIAAAKKFVANQLREDLKGFKNRELKIKNLAVAYEPIWAIGTGKNEHPESASEMAQFIKNLLATRCSLQTIRVLYGGSVNGGNARPFLKMRDIGGLLVGGASLKPVEFKKILASR